MIFISTPHGGSTLASNWIGRIGKSLIRLPDIIITTPGSVTEFVVESGQHPAEQLNKLFELLEPFFWGPTTTSIDTLSPNDPFLKTLKATPIAGHIPFHSIMGDRGRGDKCKSSDGVVKYESSHLKGEQSERLVPSGHMANQNEQGMEEVRRILKNY